MKDWFRANKLSKYHKKQLYAYTIQQAEHDVRYGYTEIIPKWETNNKLDSTKFLRLIIDQQLEWAEHFKMCKRKMASELYAINSVLNIPATTILKAMFYRMIQPYLTCGLRLWGSTYKRQINKIEIIQKRG